MHATHNTYKDALLKNIKKKRSPDAPDVSRDVTPDTSREVVSPSTRGTPIYSGYHIIERSGFHYVCTGAYHLRARILGIQHGETISIGDMYMTKYDEKDSDYLYVRAIVKHQDKWWYVPSSFSAEGTISVDPASRNSPSWKYISAIDYKIQTLPRDVCIKICPGYLDR